jgi:hypothetical protein
MEYEFYKEVRDGYSKSRVEAQGGFDKTLIALSTGELVLSIGFIEKIGRPYSAFTNLLIISAWAVLTICVVSNILSFYFAEKHNSHMIDEIDQFYQKQEPGKLFGAGTKHWSNTSTSFFNHAALVTFLIGTVLFSVYVVKTQFRAFNPPAKQEIDMTIRKGVTTKPPIAPPPAKPAGGDSGTTKK